MKTITDLSLFKRNRNFRYLYMGQFVSFIGTMITNSVALTYQIYHLTNSTLMVGLLSLAQLIPLLFTALMGGVMADRYHRRQLLIYAEITLSIACLILAYNASLAQPSILCIFIVGGFMSAMSGLHRPALESMVQQIVPKKDFPTVSSLASFKFNFCMILGPAIAGLLIAHFGLVPTFVLDFATFAFSLVMILLLRNIPKPEANRDESTWAALKSGVRYAKSRQELVGSYLIDFIAMIFGMPMALFPAIAESFGGVKTLGLLYSAPAVGALFMSFFTGWVANVHRHGVGISVSASLWGVAIILFGLASNLAWALFFLALAGAADAVSGIFRMTMWNQTIPNNYRGRLAGIEMISYLSGPKLGDTEAGLVAAAFGIPISIISGGVLCVVGVALSCLFLPKFWRYRAEVD